MLFVGNLKRAKGVRVLADAILSLGNPFLGCFWVTVQRRATEPPIRAHPASGLPGARRHEEVMHYLSAADVLVLPSYSEGLPTVLVEAGSALVSGVAERGWGVPRAAWS